MLTLPGSKMFNQKIVYQRLSESSDSDTSTPTPTSTPIPIPTSNDTDKGRQHFELLIEDSIAQLLTIANQLLPYEPMDSIQTASFRQLIINMSLREFRKKVINDMDMILNRLDNNKSNKSNVAPKGENDSSRKLPALKLGCSSRIELSSSSSDDNNTDSTLLPDDDDADDEDSETMKDISGLPSCEASPTRSSVPFASSSFSNANMQINCTSAPFEYIFPANFPPSNLPRSSLVFLKHS